MIEIQKWSTNFEPQTSAQWLHEVTICSVHERKNVIRKAIVFFGGKYEEEITTWGLSGLVVLLETEFRKMGVTQ